MCRICTQLRGVDVEPKLGRRVEVIRRCEKGVVRPVRFRGSSLGNARSYAMAKRFLQSSIKMLFSSQRNRYID
jgi:hypothetical protein